MNGQEGSESLQYPGSAIPMLPLIGLWVDLCGVRVCVECGCVCRVFVCERRVCVEGVCEGRRID
jgi:hypothetical protein